MTHKLYDEHENTIRLQINAISLVFYIMNKDKINIILYNKWVPVILHKLNKLMDVK